jgi:Raf kinase inhibitor-like YbhB/YbcL family protein
MKELKVIVSVSMLPSAYTCDGENKSPPLEIHGIDNSVSKSLALIMNDPDAPAGGGFTHWIMWNMELVSILPEDIPKAPAIKFPISAFQGKNNFGTIGYSGPCPPTGQTHRYDFKVYGLDTILTLVPGSAKGEFIQAMAGHVVQYGEASVRYGR